ncbi:hypothetical protein M440DRAFT_1399225 [Trichoderma longibrachiatum ATCC 18648]|uniref:Phosphoacetylglucosamine mutase n=1 Tax=Trichoderma longibrachiatum ATCC 18648 TaxID=983965 RepID=A0A2T4C903_TRILO|nr:hypothetical protein M440DRAFT_1399225 [Trichoderma longibrachiatum ATCC 18648]
MDDAKFLEASAKHPIVEGHVYKYGTAGFRMKADLLPGVSFRVGLIAGLRSRKLNGQAIGVMVTASHNPAPDNGVKIVDCGADFVKTKQRAPPTLKPAPEARCCSLDGDADRLIYYWADPDSGFFMLDGDRISSLNASFISDLVRSAGLQDDLRIGVVQTAYANGASTTYIEKNLQLPVVFTPTGVKHLHHAACQFDVGVYFEANGHGTVVFSQEALRAFRETKPQSPAQKDALETLAAVGDLINQTVGDAISDMLMVEVILAHKAWSLQDWATTYTDLPNRLVRVEVANKDIFETTDAERRLSHPPGAQDEIDQCVRKYTTARSFARASGTENACRVYAEAATRHEADELATKVASIIKQYGS